MVPGPVYVYACSQCGMRLMKGSLLSSNNIRERLYSDGYRDNPGMGEKPNLVQCSKCKTFFWLSKLKEVGTYHWSEPLQENWQGPKWAEHLSIEGYMAALVGGAHETPAEELYIRQRIWWAYNDRMREEGGTFIIYTDASAEKEEKQMFNDDADEQQWQSNLGRLMNLLDTDNINDRIMRAEILRHLGRFDECIQELEAVPDDTYGWVKKVLAEECTKENRWVIDLSFAQK